MAQRSAFQFGRLEKVVKKRLSMDNDAKIIIQGADSQTGIGKTTLAIKIARAIDDEWTADEKAFVDVQEYINAHLNKPAGSVLLLDEIEAGADSRRFMSQENVDLSQAWATMRARNIVTIATLPSISMLDNRMIELADFWILVKRRGLAQPYSVHVNDFTGKVRREPFPGDEHIQFADLPDGDADKEHLDSLKDDMLQMDESGYIKVEEHQKELEKRLEEKEKEIRDGLVQELYEKTSATQSEISDLSFVEMHQSQVSRVVNAH
jgi:hypothetical protein